MIPSGYIDLTGLPLIYTGQGVQHYIDTGVYPSNLLEVELLGYGPTQQGNFFGARNTASTSSQGQYGFFNGGGSTNYFLYNAARVSISADMRWDQGHFYGNKNNTVWQGDSYIVSATGSTASFTGTRTMYVGGINNAGTVLGGSSFLMNGLIIKENGTKTVDLIPCYDSANDRMGAYNLVNDTFIPVVPTVALDSTDYHVTITDTEGGAGFARTFHGDLVKEIYGFKQNGKGLPSTAFTGVNLEAVADEGYEFENWTANGTVISYDAEFTYIPESAITVTANFRKVTSKNLNQRYFAKIMPYGNDYLPRETLSLEVLSANIVNDAVQKSTSKIICKEVPTAVHVGRAVLLYSPKGKLLYIGVINSVEDNTLNCQEILSIYDQTYIARPTTLSSSNFTVTKGIDELLRSCKFSTNFNLSSSTFDPLLNRKLANYLTVDETLGTTIDGRRDKKYRFLSLYHDKNQGVSMPMFEETGTINLEEYFQSLFNNFGVYVDVAPYRASYILVKPIFYKLNSGLTLSDNYERISNVSVTSETQEFNALVIYNEEGTTLRGMYAMKQDGTVEQYSTADPTYLAYSDYKANVETTNDNIEMVIAQNLTSSALNHKITFNLDLGGMFTLDKLKVGMPIDFYTSDRLFRSVVTAISFDILENVEEIKNCTITLGKVRTNLTSKLNLGKVK